MKVLFLTDNFPPEVNAPATRTYEHCAEWVKQGINVTVITGFPNYPIGKVYKGYRNKLVQKEIVDGIKVIRVWTIIFPNEGRIRRILDYLSFAVSALIAGIFIRTDLIVATSPQILTAVSGSLLSFIKRKPWVMEVRDLWPASIKKLKAIESGKIIGILFRLEKLLYKSANHIVVVTDSFKKVIISKGIDSKKISVVHNGVNHNLIKKMPRNKDIINKLGLKNKIVFLYLGTIGMAHKLDFILHCAKNLANLNYHFLFIGEGANKANLIKLKDELELENVTILDLIRKQQVPSYLSITDIVLVHLKKLELFETVVPSKIFEAAAMQKPILLGVEGESRHIIEKFNAGLCFEPENEKDFQEKLSILATNKESYKACQEGCKKLADSYDRNMLANRMLDVLKNCIK